MKPKHRSTSEQVSQFLFSETLFQQEQGQLVDKETGSGRAASRKLLERMHPGNRFRLMAGYPLLPEQPGSGESH